MSCCRCKIACRSIFPSVRFWFAISTLAWFSGCGGQEPIREYVVPKPEVVYAQNHVDSAAAKSPSATVGSQPVTDRLLGAVLPHGAQTWYFKMTGPTAAVAKQVQKFRALIESVTFDDAGKPAWKLPEGWDEKPGSGQRVATIVANSDGQSLELSVIPMPTGGSAESLLDNINRWRRQMGQAPLQSTQLSAETQQLQLGDTSATLVDFEGRLQKTMGSQGSLAQSLPAAGPERGDLKFKLPDGWFEAKPDVVSRAAFGVRDGDQSAHITVSLLGGDAGGLLPNVNRWREQVGLPDMTAEALKEHAEALEVGGITGSYVESFPVDKAPAAMAVTGWIGMQADHSWFVKMRGNAPLVRQQREQFRTFLKSLKFPAR